MKKELEIFIASSNVYVKKNKNGKISVPASNNGRLKKVIEAIKEAGFKPFPWWSDPNFRDGKTILTNLITASKKYDGGVFILNKDIVTRKNSKKGFPNINVLLEAGMFYSSKGIDNTFLITDGNYSDINIPSDLSGYIIADLDDSDIKDRIKKFFDERDYSNENTFDKVSYFISNYISQQIVERNYEHWETKGLYIGNKSARIWNKIENSYSYKVNITALKDFIDETVNDELIDFRKIDNVISFGCGNGKTDNFLLQKIAETNVSISYVPIDINPILIYYASKNIDKTIRLPFSIVDDFEIEVGHIQKIIDGKKDDIGEKNLFIMLGVTFSNLEGTESTIINKIKKWMSNGDYFLMDVSINKDDDSDNLKKALKDEKYKNLLYNSLLKKEIIEYSTPIENIDFTVSLIDNSQRNKYTDIESTKVYSYKYNEEKVLISKRYDFDDIKQKIETNFNLINSKPVNSQNNRDKAFYLFKNK